MEIIEVEEIPDNIETGIIMFFGVYGVVVWQKDNKIYYFVGFDWCIDNYSFYDLQYLIFKNLQKQGDEITAKLILLAEYENTDYDGKSPVILSLDRYIFHFSIESIYVAHEGQYIIIGNKKYRSAPWDLLLKEAPLLYIDEEAYIPDDKDPIRDFLVKNEKKINTLLNVLATNN